MQIHIPAPVSAFHPASCWERRFTSLLPIMIFHSLSASHPASCWEQISHWANIWQRSLADSPQRKWFWDIPPLLHPISSSIHHGLSSQYTFHPCWNQRLWRAKSLALLDLQRTSLTRKYKARVYRNISWKENLTKRATRAHKRPCYTRGSWGWQTQYNKMKPGYGKKSSATGRYRRAAKRQKTEQMRRDID